MDTTTVMRQRRARHIDRTTLIVEHIQCALGDTLTDAGARHGRAVIVEHLYPVVIVDTELGGIALTHPDHGATAEEGEHEEVVIPR